MILLERFSLPNIRPGVLFVSPLENTENINSVVYPPEFYMEISGDHIYEAILYILTCGEDRMDNIIR